MTSKPTPKHASTRPSEPTDRDPTVLKDITSEALLLMAASGTEITDLLLSAESRPITGNAHLWVLVSLRMGGAARPVGLAESLGMTTGGMTKVIDHLEGEGLVARTSDPTDGRGRIVALTESGSAHVDEVLDLLAPAIDRLMRRFEALLDKAATIKNPGD
jgi:DNA-binding MarR family transcriptional regulator